MFEQFQKTKGRTTASKLFCAWFHYVAFFNFNSNVQKMFSARS
jgi:hypothetical protein